MSGGNESELERRVALHLDLPRRAAALILPRVRGHVEFAELVSLGNAGLVEAARRYDPERGVPFSAYAWYRVQGSIFDGLRRMTNLPRRAWAKLVALRAASDYLEQRADRDAGAAKRGAPPRQTTDALLTIRQAMSAIRTMYMTSLEALEDSGFEARADTTPPEDRLDASRIAKRLHDAIAALPDRERALVTKHYWEGKDLVEAGAELGISKSWASRLHAQAVDRIRAIVDREMAPPTTRGSP